MPDVRGQAEALTVLTRIVRGREKSLARVLASLPPGELSPLARLPGTHFARWVIVPDLVYRDLPPDRDELASQYLLFTSTFDVGPTDYVDEIRARMPDEADAIWSHCDQYPGSRDPEGFRRYLKRHRLRTGLFVAAYPDASLSEVRVAVDWRRKLAELAPRAQHMDAASLQEAFLEAFRAERGEDALAPSA